MEKQLDFEQINHSINFPQFRVDVCEMEGCLLGLLATSNGVESNTWLSYFDLDKVALSKNQLTELDEFHQFYQNYDWHNDFSPEFLFVQFDGLKEKIVGLTQFASGFLFALGMNPNQFKKLTDECQEFVEHLTEFSQISIDDLVFDESEELYFEQLYEFTRAGVSLMMAQNPTLKEDQSKKANQFHPSKQIH